MFLLRIDEARRALRTGDDMLAIVTARSAERAWAVEQPGPASYGTPPPEADLSGLPPAPRLVHESVGWLIDRIVAPEAVARVTAGPTIEGIAASTAVTPERYGPDLFDFALADATSGHLPVGVVGERTGADRNVSGSCAIPVWWTTSRRRGPSTPWPTTSPCS